jgi:papilin
VSVAIVLAKGRSYSVGSDMAILCNVTGEPTPEISWYKDNRQIVGNDRIEIPGELIIIIYNYHFTIELNFIEPNRIIIRDTQPSDSGNYRCVAKNEYSSAHAAEVISVEGN